MPERRRYSRKQKVAVVSAAAASSVLAAAQESRVPESTIRYWLEKPEFASLRDRTREEMADEMKVIAHIATDRLRTLIPTMDARDLTVLTSMAIDKSQLLSGGATGRTEHKDITDSFDDAEWESLKSILREAADAGV
jgi:putative lipase involved disintegration of autophagic bodies